MNKPPGPISEGLSLPEYLSHYGHRIVVQQGAACRIFDAPCADMSNIQPCNHAPGATIKQENKPTTRETDF